MKDQQEAANRPSNNSQFINNDLFQLEAERQSQQLQNLKIQPTRSEEKKVKITFDEYQRISTLVVQCLRNLET